MIRKLFAAEPEGHLILSVIQAIRKRCGKLKKIIRKMISIPLIYGLSRSIRVEDNKILFLTFRGEYDCNAKWIAEEIRKRNLPYTVVWGVYKGGSTESIPKSFIPVCRGSKEFYREIASARIIVDNGISTSTLGYRKKKNQTLIETWHGSLGIKKFSKDTNKDKKWCLYATFEGKMTDYCLSNSTFEDAIFMDTFWGKSRILRLGHARNDILCEKNTDRIAQTRQKIYQSYQLQPDIKICLYAPTFRDDKDMRPYQVDYERLRQALKTRFGGEWVVFTRFHFRLRNKPEFRELCEGTINVSDYSDIQELLTCTDVGITDYSSWICDYLLTRRPGFLFATDMEEYEKKDREFFYPLDSMPFPLALNNEQLYENILSFDEEVFKTKCETFLADKGCIDDGHASERIVDAIECIMRGETV